MSTWISPHRAFRLARELALGHRDRASTALVPADLTVPPQSAGHTAPDDDAEPLVPRADRLPEPDSVPAAYAPQRPDQTWRAVVNAIPDAAIALDSAGLIVHHNSAVVELFPRVRRGQPISNVIRSPELLEALDRVRDAENRIIVQLHDRVPVSRRLCAIITPLSIEPASEGAPVLLVVLRDVTDQEKLAQMRADFIAYASHELRTPLASLRGFVETLQGPARDDASARDRFLAIMATQASRMTRLIDDLLSLSRVEMQAHVPPRGVVDLNEVAGFVAQSLEPLAQLSGATLTLERLPGAARVRGEREELVQVLQNLVQNAIKYGRQGGRVTVAVTREPPPARARGAGRLAVAVTDNGQGIAEEHLPRLTERFYRVSAAASRDKGGTGLGLAIVKHIVSRHRGDLRITSKVGVGSTFSVVLDELAASQAAQPLDSHV